MGRNTYPSLWARILANCTVDPVTGCWLWTAMLHAEGQYALMNVRLGGKHRKVRVIRLVASLLLGRDLDRVEETIEHTCLTTACIRPNCLGMMTNADNARAAAALRAGREHDLPMTLLVDSGFYWHPEEPIPF